MLCTVQRLNTILDTVLQAVSLSVGQCDTVWSLDRGGSLHQLSVTDLAPRDPGEEEDWTMVQ